MRVMFTTVMGLGKKQIKAELHAADGGLKDPRELRSAETLRATATTGLLAPEAATERAAAELLLREFDRLRADLVQTLVEQGLLDVVR